MIVLILLAVAIGGIVEIVPLFFQKSTTAAGRPGLKPYTALQLAGRDIYIREGCYNCHSQMIRPLHSETLRYGPFSTAGEFVYDHPFQWGSKRTGPDLHRVGGKYSDEWHRIHLINPRDLVPESNMPAYPWLVQGTVDADIMPAKMKALRTVGVPYSDDEIAEGRRRGQGQDRDGGADRLPAGARHRTQVSEAQHHGHERPAQRADPGASSCSSSPSSPGPGPQPQGGLRRSCAPAVPASAECEADSDRRTRRRALNHERFRLQRLVLLRRRDHDRGHRGLPSALDGGCASSRPPGCDRQHHGPRLGRGPAGAEQPAAALVDVAVRHHGRLCRRLPGLLSRPGQLRRFASAGRSVGEVQAEQKRRPSRLAPRLRQVRRDGRNGR